MHNEHVLYLGRMVPKKNFRAYVYDKDNNGKLVNTWTDYEEHLASGLWFSTKRNIDLIEAPIAKKRRAK